MSNCIPDSHAKILQIRLLSVVPRVAAALSLAQQLYQRWVGTRRLWDGWLQTGLVLVIMIVDFLCSWCGRNWHRCWRLVRLRQRLTQLFYDLVPLVLFSALCCNFLRY